MWNRPRPRGFRYIFPCALGLSLASACLAPPATGQAPDPSQPYTLHVFEDLVEVPTLVLTSSHKATPGLSPASFQVTVDGGPVSHPRHTRLEANDPITLSILLDVSQKDPLALTSRVSSHPQQPPPDLFTPDDRLTVLADDCTLARSLHNEPATLTALRTGIAQVLASPTLHGTAGPRPHCGSKRRLWDIIGTAILQLKDEPGRRVLVVATDGADQGSQASPEQVRQLAVHSGVTVFGIRPEPYAAPTMIMGLTQEQQAASTSKKHDFDSFCARTGGLTFQSDTDTLETTLTRIVDLLRHRYILDFQRPAYASAGVHNIEIKTPDAGAIIRISGTVFPARNPHQRDDPTVVPTDLSNAPQFGSPKTLPQ